MNKRDVGLIVLVALIFTNLVWWVLRLRARPPAEVAVGESAPNFELPTLARGTASLHDYPHQVIVLNFWATWCAPCVEEAPSLEKFAEQVRSDDVAVIAVSVDQNQAQLETFVADHHLTFPIARDPQQVLAGRYGSSVFPETYILDRRGHVAEKIIGAIDWTDPRIIDFVRELAHPRERASR